MLVNSLLALDVALTTSDVNSALLGDAVSLGWLDASALLTSDDVIVDCAAALLLLVVMTTRDVITSLLGDADSRLVLGTGEVVSLLRTPVDASTCGLLAITLSVAVVMVTPSAAEAAVMWLLVPST